MRITREKSSLSYTYRMSCNLYPGI